MPTKPATSNAADRAFNLYKDMTPAERERFSLLCRGFDSAAAPKPSPERRAKPAPKAAAAGGKESTIG